MRPEPDPRPAAAETRPDDGPGAAAQADDTAGTDGPGAAAQADDAAGHERPADAAGHEPLGLRAQIGATRLAVIGFVRAHIDLAKAELEDIKGEVGRAAALGGIALAVVLLASLLASIGGILFTGEWIFGSIGWGVLLGVELLLAIAVTAVLVALRVPGLGRDVALAFVVGLAVALVLGFELPNRLFTLIGDATAPGLDAAVRPLAVGVVVVGVLGALAGAVVGARSAGGAGGIIGGLVTGALGGMVIGAFLAISFGLRVGAALGVAVFLVAWPALMGVRTQRQGIDVEQLKARFYPATSIETTKESIEWAKARFPRGPR